MHSIKGNELERGQGCARYLLGSEGGLIIGGPRIEVESLAIAVAVLSYRDRE